MYILAVIFLCGLISQTFAVPKQCEKDEIDRCGKKYRRAVRDGLDHCGRLQVMIDCLAEKPTCKGKVITSLRFWMLQMGLMDTIMSKCQTLKTTDLKTLLQATITDPSMYVDSVSSDSSKPCASRVHDYCVGEYIDNLRNKRVNLCTAIDNLNGCYKKAALEGPCEAAIIKDFARILNKVASRVTNILTTNVPEICGSV